MGRIGMLGLCSSCSPYSLGGYGTLHLSLLQRRKSILSVFFSVSSWLLSLRYSAGVGSRLRTYIFARVLRLQGDPLATAENTSSPFACLPKALKEMTLIIFLCISDWITKARKVITLHGRKWWDNLLL